MMILDLCWTSDGLWFPQIRRFVDPLTCCERYYTPRGRFVHIPPRGPCSDWATDFGTPWWKDSRYQVGLLSAKVRWIRIVNTLTSQEQLLEVRASSRCTLGNEVPASQNSTVPQVCSEETLEEILHRYRRYNSHAHSYTWKHLGEVLDMTKTLSQNGVVDEDPELDRLRLDRDIFTPSILLHFNDDLTEG